VSVSQVLDGKPRRNVVHHGVQRKRNVLGWYGREDHEAVLRFSWFKTIGRWRRVWSIDVHGVTW
jgi:hypothetical protein